MNSFIGTFYNFIHKTCDLIINLSISADGKMIIILPELAEQVFLNVGNL